MLRKLVWAGIAVVAVNAALNVYLENKEKEVEEELDEENEVNFINIMDDEDEELDETKMTPFHAKQEGYANEIEEISDLYTHLHPDFIASVFEKKEEFDEEYPVDTLIEISHSACFPSEKLNDLCIEVMRGNGYTCIKDGLDLVLRRKLFTEDASILSDIYNVANQVACLDGEYLGYTIEK